MAQKVFVGMSGGVDSSLSAAILVEQGYQVVGVYMKNWTKDLPGFVCPWREDFKDAKTVAVQLGIPLLVFDFEKEYRSLVVDYMLDGYRQGITPNPDIMCNQEIKFKLFFKTAVENGADLIATGHYARSINGKLYKGLDEHKDQSYFLYRIEQNVLQRVLFPIGGLTKTKVRQQATKRRLITADKPDSQGICFVGEIGIKQFLLAELGEQPIGDIIDQHGNKIGRHDGAIYYTIGQRHGLNIGGGLPYYVIDKDIQKNIVYVTTDLNDRKLWSSHVKLINLWWINKPPRDHYEYQIKVRYRTESVNCQIKVLENEFCVVDLDDEVRAVSPGQSAVLYDQDLVIGGGIIQFAK
jgi:tRNA-specific 2-thiouridylase